MMLSTKDEKPKALSENVTSIERVIRKINIMKTSAYQLKLYCKTTKI